MGYRGDLKLFPTYNAAHEIEWLSHIAFKFTI